MSGRSPSPWSGLVCAAAAAAGLLLYVHLTPPLRDPAEPLPRLLAALPGDLPLYGLRFLASAVGLGLLPLGAALAAGERPATLGLVRPRGGMRAWMLLPLLALAVLAGLVAAFTPDYFAYYPYSRTLARLTARGAWGLFPLHAALYLLLYYLPWEVLFRGILIFPFARHIAGTGSDVLGEARPLERLRGLLRSPGLLAVACLQVIPSSLLHLGHPPAESVWALLVGLVFGLLTLQTGSLLPALAFHATLGISLDLFIVLRLAGAAP